jgi:hypothetical protein
MTIISEKIKSIVIYKTLIFPLLNILGSTKQSNNNAPNKVNKKYLFNSNSLYSTIKNKYTRVCEMIIKNIKTSIFQFNIGLIYLSCRYLTPSIIKN